jgi:nicotinamide-nucleotide amidase
MAGNPQLLQFIGERLLARHLMLAVAESCTGGLLAARIIDVPGSSAYFEGGVVTYSYAAKQSVLGIAAATLERYGAVSEPVARAMASGVRGLLKADIALAVTGIAGPSGGTLDKPVGLTYIALAATDADLCRQYHWSGNRARNRQSSVNAALEMLKEYLQPTMP